jgi:hypothetical protein
MHCSNGRGREGSINRCGNSVVRYTLIEMAWRMLRWQKEYSNRLVKHRVDGRDGGFWSGAVS